MHEVKEKRKNNRQCLQNSQEQYHLYCKNVLKKHKKDLPLFPTNHRNVNTERNRKMKIKRAYAQSVHQKHRRKKHNTQIFIRPQPFLNFYLHNVKNVHFMHSPKICTDISKELRDQQQKVVTVEVFFLIIITKNQNEPKCEIVKRTDTRCIYFTVREWEVQRCAVMKGFICRRVFQRQSEEETGNQETDSGLMGKSVKGK